MSAIEPARTAIAGIPLRRVLPRYVSINEFDDEETFRARLGSILTSYGFGVYYHDPGFGPQFHVHGAPGYVDMYLVSPSDYDWSDRFPRIAVETKLAKNLKWLRKAEAQVQKYIAQVTTARYEIDGETVPSPDLFLICTQDSWATGHLYEWNLSIFRSRGPEYRQGYLDAQTDEIERRLWPDAAILRGGPDGTFFRTNKRGNGGAVQRYEVAW